MKRFLLVIPLVAALAGCGSPVKLDSVPVEDRSLSGLAIPKQPATSMPSVQSGVTPVNLGGAAPNAAVLAASRTIYFDFDSFIIRSEFQPQIETIAKIIKANTTKKLAIEGHTDERGGREYNLALGQKRADSVRHALALLGVAESQMEAVSFGKEKPAMAGLSEAAMEKNRRAEVNIR